MKRGDDKWAGPFSVKTVYLRACLVDLPPGMKIFLVFHNSLLRPKSDSNGLPGQDAINEAKSWNIRGRILEQKDSKNRTNEIVEKWEFEDLLDSHNEARLQSLVKWKYHPPSWQPALDLKGQDDVLLDFHRRNPNKPGLPSRVRRNRTKKP
jgi:hypothetical protein